MAQRERWGRFSRLSLPGDRRLQAAVDWGKQNLLDLTRVAEDMQIRWTDQGKQFPPPAGSVARARWVGAGFPDYPWMFATDGEYTAFASVAVGQFEAIKDHLRALRDISDILNDRSGVVTHEVISDGSIWFGKDSRRIDPSTGETKYDFNTDETVKFPSAVALIWRWTATTPSATPCTTSPSATCATQWTASTRTATAGRRDPATSSEVAWASRSSTTRCT